MFSSLQLLHGPNKSERKELKRKKCHLLLCNVQYGHAATHVKINAVDNGGLVIPVIYTGSLCSAHRQEDTCVTETIMTASTETLPRQQSKQKT